MLLALLYVCEVVNVLNLSIYLYAHTSVCVCVCVCMYVHLGQGTEGLLHVALGGKGVIIDEAELACMYVCACTYVRIVWVSILERWGGMYVWVCVYVYIHTILANHIGDTAIEGPKERRGDLILLADLPTHIREQGHLQAIFLGKGCMVLVLCVCVCVCVCVEVSVVDFDNMSRHSDIYIYIHTHTHTQNVPWRSQTLRHPSS